MAELNKSRKKDTKKSKIVKNEIIKTRKNKTTRNETKKPKKIFNTSKNSFNTLEVVILVFISAVVSLIIGSLVTNKLNKAKLHENDENLKKFMKNYNYIIDNYYEDVDKQELINNAIKGMLDSLEDDYSYLIDEDSSDTFDIQLEGEYQGIGIEIIGYTTGQIVINNIFDDSPAKDAGLEIGDIIKKIDDIDCTSKTVTEISKYIREGSKKEFIFEIERDSEIKKINIKRNKVIIKSVDSKIIEKDGKNIGYIRIEIFSNVAYKQFKEALEKLERSEMDSLIIDVRDNTGGHLSTAVNIISLFLDSKHVIYQTETKGVVKKYYSNGNVTKKYPIVILQNGNSASASEMLSAALKEEYGATIVGEKSYGKGTVQELLDLDDDVEYKITTKKWLTPKGNWINEKGVSADVEASLSEEYIENPSEDNDNQLKKALEEIVKK